VSTAKRVKWVPTGVEFDNGDVTGEVFRRFYTDAKHRQQTVWRWCVDGKSQPWPNDNGGARSLKVAMRRAEAAARRLSKVSR